MRPLVRLMIRLGPMMPAWSGAPTFRSQFGERVPVEPEIIDLLIYKPQPTLELAARLIPNLEAELVADTGHLINMERPAFCDERRLRFFSG